ncbi:hypothetical protein [Clostridium gasigenes]|uniref:DUF8108 domain-containing protein n=1 Tax=Clostridium gasigenes TaxID=94869 RepID=A0A1H0VCA2_9CLOT|nr:hypothetical protein SAMN04488529_11581 [Clostridium gasigenes]
MKFGVRTPNFKKRVKARTTGKVKRAVKKSVNPLYGKKGMGLINDPKKAMYNKVYNKTTVSVDSLVSSNSKNTKKSNSYMNYNNNVNNGNNRKKQSLFVHIILFLFTAGIGNIIYALYISGQNKKLVYVSESNNTDYDIRYESSYENNVPQKAKAEYEVIEYGDELQSKIITWNSTYTFTFEKEQIEGYEVLREDRVVGCYYRQENIDEIIESLNNYKGLKFKLEVENDFTNEYDTNARKISMIYSVNNEVRKIHLGYLSKETALELKCYEDVRVSLIKIENINYKDTTLAIHLKGDIVQELREKMIRQEEEKKRVEEERKLKEINWNIAYETNKLAMELENMGKIEESKIKYNEAINLGFDGSHPYDRLNIIYRKEKNYNSEIENCRQAIKVFEDLVIVGRVDADGKLNRYKERLYRAEELNQKQLDKEKAIEEKANVKEEREKEKLIAKETVELKKLQEKENKEVALDVENTLRVCTICNVEKTIEEFEKSGKDSKGNNKYKHQCKMCRNELRRNNNS